MGIEPHWRNALRPSTPLITSDLGLSSFDSLVEWLVVHQDRLVAHKLHFSVLLLVAENKLVCVL
ncbi:MAG: hypothetical protein DID89_2727548393 [Candidatus Nitrotoga sp. CP45]|nr:MAG: hypothetical protein DID89_2727548393 [Candidatus Nitrotoga sp. CP45]